MFDIYHSPFINQDKVTDKFTTSRYNTPISCQTLAQDFYRWLGVTNYPLQSQVVQDWYQKMADCESGKFR
jgi:hypothetical protein